MPKNILRNFLVLLFVLFGYGLLFADHGDKKNSHKSKDELSEERYSPIPVNAAYEKECGACHVVYQPWLLPSNSWEKILSMLPAHFKETVEIDKEALEDIAEYLGRYSADKETNKISLNIIKRLNKETPLRISETFYIRKEHHDLEEAVFQRPSVGSRSNCVACHPAAGKGIFNEKQVVVPQK